SRESRPVLKRDVDLAPYTYIRIGGGGHAPPAGRCRPRPRRPAARAGRGGSARACGGSRGRDGLAAALADRSARGVAEVLILGGGANVLINDERSYPLVIKIERQLGSIVEDGDRVVAEAGAYLSRLVRRAVEAGWGGFEMLA